MLTKKYNYNSITLGRFTVWTGVSQAWTYLAALYIILVPFTEEVGTALMLFLVQSLLLDLCHSMSPALLFLLM